MAVSAIKSYCWRASLGQFPQPDDRHDLWPILMTIAARKAAALWGHWSPRMQDDGGLKRLIGGEPSPEFSATVADQMRRLLESLPGDNHRTIVLKKLERYTNDEIAASLGRSTTNVAYILWSIRATWLRLLSAGSTVELPR